MTADSIIVLSVFSGSSLPKSFLNSDQLSPLSIVPLTSEVQNELIFSRQIKKIQNQGKFPVILSDVSNAFSIQDQYPTLLFYFVFAAPSSVDEYCRDIQKNYKDAHDFIRNMEQAAQECDTIWKYDLIIPLNRACSIGLDSDVRATAEYFDSFDILQFKEELSARLRAYKASGESDQSR